MNGYIVTFHAQTLWSVYSIHRCVHSALQFFPRWLHTPRNVASTSKTFHKKIIEVKTRKIFWNVHNFSKATAVPQKSWSLTFTEDFFTPIYMFGSSKMVIILKNNAYPTSSLLAQKEMSFVVVLETPSCHKLSLWGTIGPIYQELDSYLLILFFYPLQINLVWKLEVETH